MNAKQESEVLLAALLPVAERMLFQFGEFYPYGGYMTREGRVVHVSPTDEDTEYPKSSDLVYLLRRGLQESARQNRCKALAMVLNVTATVPNTDHKGAAVQVNIEHADHYSVQVFLPYQIVGNEIVFGEVFAQQGVFELFPR